MTYLLEGLTALGPDFGWDDGQGSTKHPHMLTHIIAILQVPPGNPNPLTDVHPDHRTIGKEFWSISEDVMILVLGVVGLEVLGHVSHGSLVFEEMLFQ